jgi:predicted nucleic acid-binding protein
MKPTTYIETSIISYLTSRPNRDIVIAAHQQITHEWWENRRIFYEVYASQLVLTEAARGDKQAADKRKKVLEDISLLELKKEAIELSSIFIQQKAVSEKLVDDMLHIAVATVYGLDYLLTWNCKHIANAEIQKKIAKICIKEGYEMPIICTPEELMGE